MSSAYTKFSISVVKNLCNNFIKDANIDKKQQQTAIQENVDILIDRLMARKWFAPKTRESAMEKIVNTSEYTEMMWHFNYYTSILNNRLEQVDKLLRMCYCHTNFGEMPDRYIYLDEETCYFLCPN